MDAEEEAAAVPAAGGKAEEGDGDADGEGERRGGGAGGEEAWRAAAPPGSDGRRGTAAGPPRASKASPRSRCRRSGAAPVRPRRRRPGGRFLAARLTRPYGPAAAAAELGPGGRLPGAEGLGGGASHSQQARGCPSYRGDEHPPQPRTGLHHRRPAPDAMLRGNDASRSGRTAAERKRRRRRRPQSCRGAGRQGAEGGAGGAAGAATLRRPGGDSPPPAFACRAAWGVAGVLRRGAAWRGACAPTSHWDAGSEHTGAPKARQTGPLRTLHWLPQLSGQPVAGEQSPSRS